jgi:hypothetical protein
VVVFVLPTHSKNEPDSAIVQTLSWHPVCLACFVKILNRKDSWSFSPTLSLFVPPYIKNRRNR